MNKIMKNVLVVFHNLPSTLWDWMAAIKVTARGRSTGKTENQAMPLNEQIWHVKQAVNNPFCPKAGVWKQSEGLDCYGADLDRFDRVCQPYTFPKHIPSILWLIMARGRLRLFGICTKSLRNNLPTHYYCQRKVPSLRYAWSLTLLRTSEKKTQCLPTVLIQLYTLSLVYFRWLIIFPCWRSSNAQLFN